MASPLTSLSLSFLINEMVMKIMPNLKGFLKTGYQIRWCCWNALLKQILGIILMFLYVQRKMSQVGE